MSEPEIPSQNLGLIWSLRILGVVDMLALFAVFIPLEWMSHINNLCGLGPLPDSRIVGYLARTSSALYATHGALLFFVSSDVDRYRQLITFLAAATVVHGALILGIDLAGGMPLFWTITEGPMFAATGVLVWWLQRRERHSDTVTATPRPVAVNSSH